MGGRPHPPQQRFGAKSAEKKDIKIGAPGNTVRPTKGWGSDPPPTTMGVGWSTPTNRVSVIAVQPCDMSPVSNGQ